MSPRRLAPCFLLSALASLLLATPVAAEDAAPAPQSCAEQWRAACGDAREPTERVACLQDKRARFTRECTREQRQEIGKARRALGGINRDCRQERAEHCADARGIGEVATCLEAARDSLAGACADAVDAYAAALEELD